MAVMPKVRILHFAQAINRSDIIDTVVSRLDRERFEIQALVGLPARRSGPYPPGVPYPIRQLGFGFSYLNLPRALAALIREMRRFRPHVLHAHHFNENLVATVAARVLGLQGYVIGRHYSDHIYFLTRGLKRRLFLSAEAFCNRSAARILVPTADVASILVDRQGVPASKVAVIPFALELELMRVSAPGAPERLRAQYGLNGRYVIMAACRLSAEKGLDFLLEAMSGILASNPDARLVLLGGGPYESELRRRTQDLGLSRVVTFVGWTDAALDWIAASDVVVQPSECESYCQVLVEALAMRKPVVMTPVGIAPDVLGAGRGGLLIPMRDPAAIFHAIGHLMSHPDLGISLAEAGRQHLVKTMDAAAIAREYERQYDRLVAMFRT
jgi:glycosyltransferase involved in cell wall biosynthesis